MRHMKKITKIAILTLLPIILMAQQERGYHIFKDNKLYVEKFNLPGFGSYLQRATYLNGQIKYETNVDGGKIKSPVSYLNENGDTVAVIDYKRLKYNLKDEQYLNNFRFIDTALQIAKAHLYSKIDSIFISDYLYLDTKVSHQFATYKQKKANFKSACLSWLYEPVNYDIEACKIYFFHNRTGKIQRHQPIVIRIDTTLKVLQTNIQRGEKIKINITYAMADSIRAEYRMSDRIDIERKRGTKIYGPTFKYVKRRPVWEIEARNGKLLFDNLDYMNEDLKAIRVISIDAVTGEIKEFVRDIHPPDCY